MKTSDIKLFQNALVKHYKPIIVSYLNNKISASSLFSKEKKMVSVTSRFLTGYLNRMAKLDGVEMFAVEEYTPRTYGAEKMRVIYQIPIHLMKEFREDYEPVEGTVFGLASYVNLRYNMHIPMFDIDSRDLADPENEVMEFAKDLQKRLGYSSAHILKPPQGGKYASLPSPVHILKTTHGFHVIGEDTLSWEAYENWLFSDIVDEKFVRWSRDRGYGTLRFTSGGVKTGVPKLWKSL